MQRADRRLAATLRKGLSGKPVYRTRRERRLLEQRETLATERRANAASVARFIETDDAARRRAVRLTSSSAYGVTHRSVTFRTE